METKSNKIKIMNVPRQLTTTITTIYITPTPQDTYFRITDIDPSKPGSQFNIGIIEKYHGLPAARRKAVQDIDQLIRQGHRNIPNGPWTLNVKPALITTINNNGGNWHGLKPPPTPAKNGSTRGVSGVGYGSWREFPTWQDLIDYLKKYNVDKLGNKYQLYYVDKLGNKYLL